MAIFAQAKTAGGLKEAHDAHSQGDQVWVGRFWDEALSYQGTGTVKGAGQFIAAVEEIGWRLADMSYAWVPAKNRGVTVLIFRR